MDVADVELVEDRTEKSTCLGGFLQVRRLLLRNVYADGTRSAPYACDVMSRRHVDAVAVVLFHVDGSRRVRVVLKEGLRPAVWLRRTKAIEHREERPILRVVEIAAGMLEARDAGPGGIERRAAAEAAEETGHEVDAAAVVPLGGPMFASPGVTDERVHFRAVEVAPDDARRGQGDGSPMEEGSRPVVLDLDEAIARCRSGEVPDMKTEVALLRLCDAIGWLPQLRLFADELPPDLRARLDSSGGRRS
jgi:ADP-ribose pyrophosphatase